MSTLNKIPEYLYTQEEMDVLIREKKILEEKILFWSTRVKDNKEYMEFFNIIKQE